MSHILGNEKVKAISTLVIRTRLLAELKPGIPTPLLPHAKMLLVPIRLFFWRVDYALKGSKVLTEQK